MPIERNTYRPNGEPQYSQRELDQAEYDRRQYEELMAWRRTLRRIVLLVLFLGMLAFLIVGLVSGLKSNG
jgi:hypothetical protein